MSDLKEGNVSVSHIHIMDGLFSLQKLRYYFFC